MKKWGKIKIVNELEARGISKNCIKAGLKEISDEDYQRTLADILEKKSHLIREENSFIKRDKLSKYAIQKGYEPALVWKILKEELESGS
jgi:regulatory protein